MPKSPKEQIEKLRAEIRRHDHLYYTEAKPEISDAEYDALMRRLKELEDENPKLITADSPTQRVGGAVSTEFKPVRHSRPMLSLDNTYSIDEIKAWHERVLKGLPGEKSVEYVVEVKIDGVSLALTYENGLLTTAATRGDGETGEDVTFNARTIKSIPLRLLGKFPKVLEVRGEVYVTRAEFKKFNEAVKREDAEAAAFANARNFAAGSLRQKDPSLTAARPLRFLTHSFGRVVGADYKSHSEYLFACRGFGLPVDEETRGCKTIDAVVKRCLELQDKRDKLRYEADGAVIKVDDIDQQKTLGFTFKSPRWGVAYKFPAAQATTRVNDVLMSVGRTGAVTPIAQLEPVQCGGVTISNASLHNFDEISRLGVKIGDTVLIERAGEVIPKVLQVIESKRTGAERDITIPKACPVCGGKLGRYKEEEVVMYCLNPDCPVQIEKSLIHFAGRDAMDIEGMGEAVVRGLLERKLVSDLADIYTLTDEDLRKLEGFKDKKTENLLAAIKASRKRELSRFIYGLGIRDVGEKAALLLAQNFPSVDKLMNVTEDQLMAIREFGPVLSRSVATFFSQAAVKSLIKKFKSLGIDPIETAVPVGQGVFSGKTIVFTGEISIPRPEAEKMVRQRGGNPTGSVSKKTSFVVAGAAAGSKLDKARKLGVEIIDEEEFKKRAKI